MDPNTMSKGFNNSQTELQGVITINLNYRCLITHIPKSNGLITHNLKSKGMIVGSICLRITLEYCLPIIYDHIWSYL